MSPSRSRDLRQDVAHLAVLAVLTLAIGACGSATVTPPPTQTPAAEAIRSPKPSPEPEPTEVPPTEASEPSEAPAASSGAEEFVSEQYPYALTYPPGTMKLGWHAAERAWDGQVNWNPVAPFVDRNLIAEGGLFIFGAPTAGVDQLLSVIVADRTRYRCGDPQNRREATIDGAAAIGFTQVCNAGLVFARVVLVKDGFGIAVFVLTPPGTEVVGRDKILELLKGLEWRTG